MSESIAINPIITSLALTLIHFLWQGVLVALVLKIALSFISFKKSQLRYISSSIAMLSNLALPFITFFIIYSREQKQSITLIQNLPVLNKNFSIDQIHTTTWYSQWFDVLPFVTFTWAGIVTLLALKMLVELFNVNKLPTYGTTAVPPALQSRFDLLITKIELSRSVKLLLSTKVDVPMAIGWLKPVVLIPVSMVSGLTPQQLDMLLLHELAHIRRHDYLVNFLQTLVEILLFFHPGVRWVSKQMRNEREYCSDDIAVEHSGNPVAYAHTLADTATLCHKHRNHSIPTMAMAASGGDLKQRVTRLLSNHQHCSHTNDSGKWLASLTIILAIFVSFLQNSLTLTDIDIQSGKLSLFHNASDRNAMSNNYSDLASGSSQKKSPLAEQLIAMEKGSSSISIPNEKRPTKLIQKKIATYNAQSETKSKTKLTSTETLYSNSTNELPIVTPLPVEKSVIKLQAQLNKAKAPIIPPSANTIAERASERTDSAHSNSTMDNPYSAQVASLSDEPIPDAAIRGLELNPSNGFNFAPMEVIATALPKKVDQKSNQFIDSKQVELSKKSNITSAQLLKSVEPKYPLKAKRNGVELEVMIEFDIDKNGYVKNIKFESKSKVSMFRRAIRNALDKWRFLPAIENGVAVESKMSKIFSFSLLK